MSESIEVVDAPERHRFEILVDGELAGYTEYHEHGDERIFPHTVIHEEYGGRGLATRLVHEALDQTRAGTQRIVPYCPVVKGFIAKNPEYLECVPQTRREEVGLA